nr:rRNA 2'-O-methyltransferase fibrillarin-like [Arachis hypogaea]
MGCEVGEGAVVVVGTAVDAEGAAEDVATSAESMRKGVGGGWLAGGLGGGGDTGKLGTGRRQWGRGRGGRRRGEREEGEKGGGSDVGGSAVWVAAVLGGDGGGVVVRGRRRECRGGLGGKG